MSAAATATDTQRPAAAAPAFDLDALCARAREDLADDTALNAAIAAVEVAQAFWHLRKRVVARPQAIAAPEARP